MSPEEETEIRGIIATIPPINSYNGPITRLGGLTNRVYQLSSAVLRVPGKGTAEYINRQNEADAALIAAEAHVGPNVFYADATSGLMVTSHISHAVTMSPKLFRQRPGAAARAGAVLKKLHTSGGIFPFRFEFFSMIDDYLKILATKDMALPAGYHDVVKEAGTIRKLLDDMVETMYAAPGIGLAAPQIGVPLRVIASPSCSSPHWPRHPRRRASASRPTGRSGCWSS